MKKKPELPPTRMHVFLGAGGVGKTTLSAGYALSLARQGYSVGLMSIDPARRLATALGVRELSGDGSDIEDPKVRAAGGRLQASFLNVNACFQRWVRQEGMSEQAQERLFANKLFVGVVEKFATATDTFAAVRAAEWAHAEKFDHLVVDTAPGLHAVDFLSKPDKLLAFLDGKLIDWLKWFAGSEREKKNVFQRVVKSGARKVLDGLAQIGGQNFLLNFGEFVILLDDVFMTMMSRLELAVCWLRSPQSEFYLITSIREDAVSVARSLTLQMAALGIESRHAVINRGFPRELAADPGFQKILAQRLAHVDLNASAEEMFLNYLVSYANLQKQVAAEMSVSSQEVIQIPTASQLDGTDEIRLDDLVWLGDSLMHASGSK